MQGGWKGIEGREMVLFWAILLSLLVGSSAFVGVPGAAVGSRDPCHGLAAQRYSTNKRPLSSRVVVTAAITPDGKSKDMNEFRRSLMKQMQREKQGEDFTGYDFYDLIVDKWDVPYDIQIMKSVFAGKPMLCLNVMWRYLGQQSFHLTEQEYLEHLEAIAQLLKEWDRVEHLKQAVKEARKRPNAYFGYAVSLPLNLPPDTLCGIFDDAYFN